MRHGVLIVVLCIATAAVIADIAVRNADARAKQTTAILADEENGVVTVIVHGKEVARFDEDGLAVEGRIAGAIDPIPFGAKGSKPLHQAPGGGGP